VVFAERTALRCEILRVSIHHTPVDASVTRDYAFSRNLFLVHSEICASVLDKRIEFNKRSLVKQDIKPFSRSQLASFMQRLNPFFAASGLYLCSLFPELLNTVHFQRSCLILLI
jgi:hypothetical protein